jgi:hypothetical protein
VGDTPLREIVPVKGEPLLFVTVMNPVSGVAQIEPVVLHTAPVTVPVPDSVLLVVPSALVTVKDIPGTTVRIENVLLFEASMPEVTMVCPTTRSAPIVRE